MKKALTIVSLITLVLIYSFTVPTSTSLELTPIKDSSYSNLFSINLKMSVRDTFNVKLVDPYENVIFDQTFIGDSLYKKVSLKVDDSELEKSLILVINNKKGTIMKTFEFIPSNILK